MLTGLQGEWSTVALLAKQARLQGLMVGSRRQQQDYVAALEQSRVRPVLDGSFSSIIWPTPSVTRPAARILQGRRRMVKPKLPQRSTT